MEEKLQTNFDFEGKIADDLMSFIIDTQDGKYTKKKPLVTQITYKRVEIEDDAMSDFEDCNENVLFGISN